MEYPTLFTAGTRWIAPRHVPEPEEVTVHEAGHQFWYGIVATNEFEHAWMDEGINTYATARVIEQAFEPQHYSQRYFGGFVPWVFRDLPLSPRDRRQLSEYYRGGRRGRAGDADVAVLARHCRNITYAKTALWMHTLERMLGWDTVQRILSTYFTRYAFRHPDAAGLLRRRQRGQRPGPDLVLRSGLPQLERVRLQDRRLFTASRPTIAATSPTPERRVATERTANVPHVGRRPPRRRRRVPVDVRVVFENRQEVRWHWEGRERWKRSRSRRRLRAVSAQVDPERVCCSTRTTPTTAARSSRGAGGGPQVVA